MSIKPLICPDCRKRPTPMRRWHDKHNRVFNHLKWQVECVAGCIRVMGRDRREAICLYNVGVRDREARVMPQQVQAVPRMTLRRFFSVIWNGVGGAA